PRGRGGKQNARRAFVGSTGRGEDGAPRILGIREHETDEMTQVRLFSRLVVRTLFGLLRRLRSLQDHRRVDTEISSHERENDRAPADAAGAAETHAATIFNVRA